MISESKYIGCFKGLATGDAYGAVYEGGLVERLLWFIIGKTNEGRKRFTDDTQMSLDVAFSFLAKQGVNQDHLSKTFASSYKWTRGYGPSSAKLLSGIQKGEQWHRLNRKRFKDGSMGNGAAMRAPILALCYPAVDNVLNDYVYKVSEITHAHPNAIAGAEIMANATVMALKDYDTADIIKHLKHHNNSLVFKNKLLSCEDLLTKADLVKPKEIKKILGNGMLAVDSCVTSIYYSLKFRNEDFEAMIEEICSLGGDTDTIAAMAGAVWGASNGDCGIKHLAKEVEDIEKIENFAKKLHIQYRNDKSQVAKTDERFGDWVVYRLLPSHW